MKSNEIMGIQVIPRVNLSGNENSGHFRCFRGAPGRSDIDLNAFLPGFTTEADDQGKNREVNTGCRPLIMITTTACYSLISYFEM
jgi:hypothetical protein